MASVSDEENFHQEETGRRTRSGRKVASPITPPTRNTRRSNRKRSEQETDMVLEPNEESDKFYDDQYQEQLNDAQINECVQMNKKNNPDEINMLYEQKQIDGEIRSFEACIDDGDCDGSGGVGVGSGLDIGINDEIIVEQSIVHDEKSSSFPFGNITSDLTAIYDQSSTGGCTENIPPTESMDNLLANLAEDNANSLPSGGDDTEVNQNQCEDINISTDLSQQRQSKFVITDDNHIERSSEQIISEEKNCDENSSGNNSHQEIAIAEDLQNGEDSMATKEDLDAEMVSEDELPAPTQPKVDDAEEVSDEELPGPKLAELPADTEVVSEDELPTSNKTKRKVDEGYDPGSPTESSEGPEKKTKTEDEETDTTDQDKKKEKEKKDEKEKEKKSLPDLDKYWKAVNDDPTDFTGWTYLLQYVDMENDIEAAREAYDAFLAHYPYCYGYWRKYSDYEKRKGNKKKCEEVFERGLKAIPLSVDLWIHYLSHVKLNHTDDDIHIRSQFERALSACGLEFRSDKLWEAYIKWEVEGKRIQNVVNIYDRLLATPTQGYNGHFDSFEEIVNNNPLKSLISIDELNKLREQIHENDTKDASITTTTTTATITTTTATITTTNNTTTPTTETEELNEPNATVPNEMESDDIVFSEEEISTIKEKILSIRRKIHKATVQAVTTRWTFEEGIKRPYFHVKPLERCQLKNWKEYLDFEIEQGDQKRVLVLFERCLIACALYDEFWLKLIRYMESQNDLEVEIVQKTRDVYERACTVHHPDKPSLHLMWSAFEECHNNFQKAADILTNLDKNCPNLLQIAYRRINLERRRGDTDKCAQLYEHYISSSKNKNVASSLAIKYARFCHKIKGDLNGGIEILKQSLSKDINNTRVALQMIDLCLQRESVNETEVVEIMDNFMTRDGMEPDQKVLFAQRKVEFLEDFGSTAKGLQEAQRELQISLSKANEIKKKVEQNVSSKKATKEVPTTQSSSYGSSYGNYGSSNTYYGNNQYPQSYGSNDGYGYNQWQAYGSGYSGYGQWSGYNSGGYY